MNLTFADVSAPKGQNSKSGQSEVLEHFYAVTSSNILKIVKNSLEVGFFNKK